MMMNNAQLLRTTDSSVYIFDRQGKGDHIISTMFSITKCPLNVGRLNRSAVGGFGQLQVEIVNPRVRTNQRVGCRECFPKPPIRFPLQPVERNGKNVKPSSGTLPIDLALM